MAKNSQDLKSIDVGKDQQEELLEECIQHEHDSYSWLSTIRRDWDEKESMLLGNRPEDRLSKTAKARVFNPVLANQTIERSSRVMAQEPVGQAFAQSKNDVGKNMLANMGLKYFQTHANEEGSHVLKLRQMDVYSHVYGSYFGLVPWRVNNLNGYVGPELLPLDMRSCRPQPGKRTVDKSDWFTVRSVLSLDWLQQQDPGTWKNIDNVIAEFKTRKDKGELQRAGDAANQSYVERWRYPSRYGDEAFPAIEAFTEYRYGMWITWAPRVIDNDKSRPWILRVVENPYPKGYLPIIVKHAFPMIDSLIGLGDFERGKTLQFAMNSLINLYLDGVKYAIFPPLHINLNEVDPTSIKWGAGEKWYMNHPNQDVQIMEMRSTEWLSTFNSTYGFLSQAIQNLSGTTQVQETKGSQPALGKTPEAIKQYGLNESARDEWDRFMMEDTVNQVYERWLALMTEKMEAPLTLRIFGAELEALKKQFPDEKNLDIFESGKSGTISIDKKLLNDGDEIVKYDFVLEAGSTMHKNNQDEAEVATQIIQDFIQAPQLLQEIRTEGWDISFSELEKRRMIGGGIKDWDRILIRPHEKNPDAQGVDQNGQPTDAQGQPQDQAQAAIQQVEQAVQQAAGGQAGTPAGQPATPMSTARPPAESINFKDLPPEGQTQMAAQAGIQINGQPASVPTAAPTASVPAVTPAGPQPTQPNGQFKDPLINSVASQVLGGMSGIPPTR